MLKNLFFLVFFPLTELGLGVSQNLVVNPGAESSPTGTGWLILISYLEAGYSSGKKLIVQQKSSQQPADTI
jgi:hypothetical protein